MIKIEDIIEQFEIQNEEMCSFYNKKTGELYTVFEEDLLSAEEGEEIGAYSGEPLEKERDILQNDNWIQLPTQFDIHEWEIMEKFCYTIEDVALQDELLDAIHGSGAFRIFKSTIRRKGIEEKWYSFRYQAFKEMAIEWCEENGIEWEE
ncbi:MAG: UPF0158 family protein [bacterium]